MTRLLITGAGTKGAFAFICTRDPARYGREQVRFLQFRPVLDNTRLKRDFGYTPERDRRQVFRHWAQGTNA